MDRPCVPFSQPCVCTIFLGHSMAQGLLPEALRHAIRASSWHAKMHFAISGLCMKPEPRRHSCLTSLPTEVLIEIATNVSERHTHTGQVVEASNLAAFSRASRRLRTVALPIMHRAVILTSERKLRSFHTMPKELVGCVR
jgi:hypothetical protein